VIAAVSRAAAIAGAAALLGACVPHTPPTTPAAEDHTWQIVAHKMPGVSAMSDADAARWHGRFVHLQARRAANGVDTCDTPAYTGTTQPAEAFLAVDYRILPSGLGVPADAQVRVIEVTCGGQPWTALGGRVLSFGAAGEFAVWDGVFFVLRRVHL
jgi:hypothetical protein